MFFAVSRPEHELVKWRAGNRHEGVRLSGEIKGQQARGHVFIGDDDRSAGAGLQCTDLGCQIARTAGAIDRIKTSGQMQPGSFMEECGLQQSDHQPAQTTHLAQG